MSNAASRDAPPGDYASHHASRGLASLRRTAVRQDYSPINSSTDTTMAGRSVGDNDCPRRNRRATRYVPCSGDEEQVTTFLLRSISQYSGTFDRAYNGAFTLRSYSSDDS